MAVTLPTSSVSTATAACLSPQLPLLSLRETVAKINMPTAVVQASVVNPQVTSTATETVYNLTFNNGEIHNATSNVLPKIPSVATLAVPRDFKSDPVTSSSQKPIIVTVSGMGGMAKQLTSATNVLTTPLLSAPVHMVAQHFTTTDKLPSSSGIVTLPTLTRTATMTPVMPAKPRQAQHITPLLPGSILTSKGQLVIASANSSLIGSSSGSVITTMSGISLNSNIVTVTPVIMTSAAPLVSLPANSAVALNQMTQGQILSTMIQPNIKPTLATHNKAIVPATFLKPVNIAANPAQFPVAMQPATIAPAAIAISPAPVPAPIQAPVPMIAPVAAPSPAKESDADPKCDPKNAEFDPVKAMEWKDGIATLPGSNMKFKLNEFGTLEMITEDFCAPVSVKSVKDESTATSEDSSTESRQKTQRKQEMYKDENSADKTSLNGPKDPSMSEELCRCENCDCFGLRVEFCKSGRFCSQTCASSYSNKHKNFYKKNHCLKRAAPKEKVKKKKFKSEPNSDDNTEVKSEETCSEESVEIKKEYSDAKKEYSETKKEYSDTKKEYSDTKKEYSDTKKEMFYWDDYLKQENSTAAPVKLFKEAQTFPSQKNGFEVGMKLEGIDPKHPSLFCVLSVSEIRGYRIRLHFDDYSECYDFWVNADSPDIFPVGWCEKTGHKLQPPKNMLPQEFDWSIYLKKTEAEAAPKHLFSFQGGQTPNPNFKIGMKIEAVDKKSKSSNNRSKCMVCVATVTDVIDSRFLIHFDGWEDVYDYWADPSSPHIHPINWCYDHGENLTPPKEFKDNSFSWSKYLSETKSSAVPARCFKVRPPNEYKVGMKLEAVDKRNPILIRVATIIDRTDHALLINFDGWSNVYDCWMDDSSPDLHPAGWCSKTGHPLEPPIVTVPGQTGPCPTSGCLGQGHIKGPKYTSHHSTFGCPYAQVNINKIDSAFQDRVIITKESSHELTKKVSDQGGATDGLRRCPTPGCNGVGHVKGKYSVHHRVSGCPLAEKNALKVQQSNSASTSPTPSSAPAPPRADSPLPASSVSSENKNADNIKTRNGVGRGKKKLKFPGTGLRGRPPKHLAAMRMEAMKKAQETNEVKKADVEEKVHDSVFNAPFTNPPKEVSLSWEHNTTIIPGLSSIKGSAVRQWSVNQVAKFVSSLKGCIDQGKLFREQLIDGDALLEMNQSDLIDVLHMRLGPALKVYSSVVAFRESEKFA